MGCSGMAMVGVKRKGVVVVVLSCDRDVERKGWRFGRTQTSISVGNERRTKEKQAEEKEGLKREEGDAGMIKTNNSPLSII